MDNRTQRKVFECFYCGAVWMRLDNKGQQSKWCGMRCQELGKHGARRTCQRCGLDYFGVGKMFCSRVCARSGELGRGKAIPRASMRKAYLARDWPEVRRSIEAASIPQPNGCLIWSGQLDRWGYGVLQAANRTIGVHRMMLEAKHGASLGSQVAHHTCASTACVNPDHLQPVTHAANVAEMHARRSYIARITALETALSEASPGHPLLSLIPVNLSEGA